MSADAKLLERIDRALAGIAMDIETSPHAEKYWLFFNRLEREREQLVGRADRLAAARARMSRLEQTGQTAA